MSSTCHTSTVPGRRVRVILKNGKTIIDRFKERTGQFVVLENHRLKGRDIRAMSDYKAYMALPAGK